MTSSQITIATHNGAFHADDVFGVAVLLLLHPDAELVRTRDAALIEQADYAVDVGGIWDASTGRFDHHQKGFAGKRASGVTYASAGLVWAAHGTAAVQRLNPDLSEAQAERVRDAIDDELVQHLDRADTGEAQGAPGFFGLSALLHSFNTTRAEEVAIRKFGERPELTKALLAKAKEDQFRQAMDCTQQLLRRLVEQFASEHADADIVRRSQLLDGGRILVMEESGLSWESVVVPEMPDVLFAVYPDSTDNQYQVRTIPVALQSFTARKDLPAAWAGLRDADLAKVTGVPDSVFCHNGRFIGGAGSKEGAIALARLALAA